MSRCSHCFSLSHHSDDCEAFPTISIPREKSSYKTQPQLTNHYRERNSSGSQPLTTRHPLDSCSLYAIALMIALSQDVNTPTADMITPATGVDLTLK